MGAQGASQQTSSRHARLRYSMKLSRQSISFHLKLCGVHQRQCWNKRVRRVPDACDWSWRKPYPSLRVWVPKAPVSRPHHATPDSGIVWNCHARASAPSSRVWQGCRINHHPLKTPSYENGHKCRIVQPSVVAAIWSYNPNYRST